MYIFVYCISPLVRGFSAYLHTCTYTLYMWPLTSMEYNLSIPNI
jgi:hypothetical protein